jgi:hypothetical protein
MSTANWELVGRALAAAYANNARKRTPESSKLLRQAICDLCALQIVELIEMRRAERERVYLQSIVNEVRAVLDGGSSNG